MPMTVLITLTTAGTNSGPFNLYSDVDGFISAFETNVPKASLVAGYSSALVPNGTSIIRVKSVGVCVNYIDIPLTGITTTTTSSSSTTTTTSTSAYPCNCYSLQNTSANPITPIGYDCSLGALPTIPGNSTIQVCSFTAPGFFPIDLPFVVVTLIGDCSLCPS